MATMFITEPEYTVYETQNTTYNPLEGLKLLDDPVAHYENYDQMIADWEQDFISGTHNFFVTQKE